MRGDNYSIKIFCCNLQDLRLLAGAHGSSHPTVGHTTCLAYRAINTFSPILSKILATARYLVRYAGLANL